MKGHLQEFWTDGRILLISSATIIFAISTGVTYGTNLTWLYVAGGAFTFFVIEYLTHRFILHGLLKRILPKAHEGHERHHVEPTNLRYLLTPNTFNIPGYLFLWCMFYLIFRNIHISNAIMLGVALYQLDYEWAHFVSHRPIIPLTRFGKWMKKYHLLHHFKNPHYWYGVTNPALDMLIGTNPEPRQVPTEVPKRILQDNIPTVDDTMNQWV